MFKEIPIDVQEFIRTHIHSVGYLEVLIVFHRNPEKCWSSEELSTEMRSNPSFAHTQMEDLMHLNLLLPQEDEKSEGQVDKSKNRCRLTNDPKILDQLTKLIHVYTKKRAAVISFIYAQPMERILNFADAFKIKKDP